MMRSVRGLLLLSRAQARGLGGGVVLAPRIVALLALLLLPIAVHGQTIRGDDPVRFGLPKTAVEEIGKRTERAKTFRLGGKRRAAVSYGAPIHYRRADGKLADIDLNEEQDGTDNVLRHLPFAVRISATGIAMGDRAEGWGIKILTKSRPRCAKATHSCRMPRGGVVWTWTIRKLGLLLESAPITARRGAVEYVWPAKLLGSMPGMVVSGDGVLGNTQWTFSAPVILGADGVQYPGARWVLRGAPLRLVIAVDDTALPASALPYVIDPTAGPNYPTVSAVNATTPDPPCWSGSGRAWAGLSNVGADDGTYATNSPAASGYGRCLYVDNFGFSVPADAIVDGITVGIKKWRNTGAPRYVDKGVYLVSPLAEMYGTNHADTSTDWPNPAAWVDTGGTADMWGTGLTPAGVNDSDFGVYLSITKTVGGSSVAKVDAIRITITYHMPTVSYQLGVCCSDEVGTDCESPVRECTADSTCTVSPYTLCAGASGDDVLAQGNDTVFASCNASSLTTGKCSFLGGGLSNVALIQHNTVDIPDTATITEARLRVGMKPVVNTDSRNIVVDPYDWGGTCDSADWTLTDQTGGSISSDVLPHVSGTDVVDIVLNTSDINAAGMTRLRMTATGVVPTIGTNGVCMDVLGYDATAGAGPELLISYDTATPTPTGAAPTPTPPAGSVMYFN